MSTDQDHWRPPEEAVLAGTLAPRLLLVADDDDDMVRRATAAALGRVGYEVPKAGNADDALICMQEHGSSVASVLSDVITPRQSGYEFAQAVRARWPRAKVGLMSARALAAIDRQVIETSGLRRSRKPIPDTRGIAAQLIGPERSI